MMMLPSDIYQRPTSSPVVRYLESVSRVRLPSLLDPRFAALPYRDLLLIWSIGEVAGA